MPSEVALIVDSVERARAAVLECVADTTEGQARFKPDPTEWSIVEVLEHLYLAELSGVTKIWAAAIQRRAGQRWTQETPNQGKTIEQVVSETWRTKETAPPIATPHVGGPLDSWRSAFRSLTRVLEDLAVVLEGVSLDEVVFPHFLSGPLDARQRLEFLRYHMERHLGQIHRIQKNPRFAEHHCS